MPIIDDYTLSDTDFDHYHNKVSIIKQDLRSLVDPIKHLSKSTSSEKFEALAKLVESFEKGLEECKWKLKSSKNELEQRLNVTQDVPVRKLLEMEFQNKEMFIKIVTQHIKELNSDKFYLMEEMQRLYVITDKDDAPQSPTN